MAQIYRDLYQNHIEDLPLKWHDIMNMVRNPEGHEDKVTMPLWSFYHVDDYAEQTWAGVKAIGNSMEFLLCMMVDYDCGVVKLSDVEEMFDFQFVAYSSPTSTPEKSKFRMIIPFSEPVPNKYLKCKAVRQFLMKQFPNCDESTFDYFRRQRIPCTLPTTDYAYIEKAGDRIVPDIAHMEALWSAWVIEQESFAKSNVKTPKTNGSIFKKSFAELEELGFLDNLKAKYAIELADLDMDNRGNGIVHDTLRRIIYSLRKNDMDEDAIEEFVDDNLADAFGINGEIEQLIYGIIH